MEGTSRASAGITPILVGVLLVVGVVLLLGIGSTPAFDRGLNVLFEDSSFIVSLGGMSIIGCVPYHLCTR